MEKSGTWRKLVGRLDALLGILVVFPAISLHLPGLLFR